MASNKTTRPSKNSVVEVALRERIKELECLYGISKIAVEQRDIQLDGIINNILKLLPPAWQYPDITVARIVIDENNYATSDFKEGLNKQVAYIVIKGKKRGIIEIIYIEERPELDEGPFLAEERSLIETIAKELANIVERKENEVERAILQSQLQHADRLATVGELSAGVAHELNEPLASILGFSQLLKKSEELSKQATDDIDKIINSSLHAREVVKKLMFFSRQMPTENKQVNLNEVIEEGLYFLESRCVKEGIKLERSLAPKLPDIIADPVQLNQVLVNLVVNAIQAMPGGGKLNVQTTFTDNNVSLVVEDTGIGMSDEVKDQLFEPFYTTKEIGQGTGLGLSVVYGIVDSHNGIIDVKSSVGNGTRFEIKLPVANKKVK